jgi:hypothetical protein
MAWIKAGTTTLGSAGDDLDITSMTASKFNMIIFHKLASGDADPDMTFNNDSTSKYAIRYNQDGASDGTGMSESNISARVTADDDEFFIQYVCSISGEEKLGIGFNCARNTAGAGNATRRMEFVFKYVPSPDADITRIDFNNDLSGSYDTDSNVTALGSDGTTSMTVQDGAIYYSTDENKEFVLYNNIWSEV